MLDAILRNIEEIEIFVIIMFIIVMLKLPKGIWQTDKKLKERSQTNVGLEAIKKEIQAKETQLIMSNFEEPLSNTEIFSYFKEKLFRSIDYAIKRHDWYEDQRSKIFQQTMTISFAILTISLTVSGIVIKERLESEIFWCLGTFILLATISIAYSAWLYNWELDRDRPYRLASDIRFWYFRYNLPGHSGAAEGLEDIISQATAVLKERQNFTRRATENIRVDTSLREDMEQLFILHVLQSYKSESLSRLRWLLVYLSIFTSIEVVITYVVLAGRYL